MKRIPYFTENAMQMRRMQVTSAEKKRKWNQQSHFQMEWIVPLI